MRIMSWQMGGFLSMLLKPKEIKHWLRVWIGTVRLFSGSAFCVQDMWVWCRIVQDFPIPAVFGPGFEDRLFSLLAPVRFSQASCKASVCSIFVL